MGLPIRTLLEDIDVVCGYLAKKPTGASVAEARKVLDGKHLDGRKLAALKAWGLIEETGDRLRLSAHGRQIARDPASRQLVLLSVIRRIPAYAAIIERAAHKGEDSLTATDIAAHWHQHFSSESGDSDKILNDQAVCFFQIAEGAGLGRIVVGRRGQATRFQFDKGALRAFLDPANISPVDPPEATGSSPEGQSTNLTSASDSNPATESQATASDRILGQAIFVAHGKNKKPLEQLKRILEQFKIPYRIATEEPNLGRPISSKVKEVMASCNCAILLFTGDEEFRDAKGNEFWRPSENVVFELGAAGYLYGNRIVIMKEEGVEFPSNFRDLGYISFTKDQLEAKAMEVLKELIGFGIVKIST